jgi:hypothetical protein
MMRPVKLGKILTTPAASRTSRPGFTSSRDATGGVFFYNNILGEIYHEKNHAKDNPAEERTGAPAI